MSAPLAVFMFGYWGWGNATEQLIQAVDAAEGEAGFRPPVFADIRIHRKVRAKGFVDGAFESLLGRSRYRWFQTLGNENAGQAKGRGIQIRNRESAASLLDLAVNARADQRRVIFFCGCEAPCDCHRTTVGRLLLKAARKRGLPAQVVEWPGGEPAKIDVAADPQEFRRVSKGARKILIPQATPLYRYAGLPWGSLARIHAGDGTSVLPVGPAKYSKGWYLPVLLDDQHEPIAATENATRNWRRMYGYDPL